MIKFIMFEILKMIAITVVITIIFIKLSNKLANSAIKEKYFKSKYSKEIFEEIKKLTNEEREILLSNIKNLKE